MVYGVVAGQLAAPSLGPLARADIRRGLLCARVLPARPGAFSSQAPRRFRSRPGAPLAPRGSRTPPGPHSDRDHYIEEAECFDYALRAAHEAVGCDRSRAPGGPTLRRRRWLPQRFLHPQGARGVFGPHQPDPHHRDELETTLATSASGTLPTHDNRGSVHRGMRVPTLRHAPIRRTAFRRADRQRRTPQPHRLLRHGAPSERPLSSYARTWARHLRVSFACALVSAFVARVPVSLIPNLPPGASQDPGTAPGTLVRGRISRAPAGACDAVWRNVCVLALRLRVQLRAARVAAA